VTTSPPEQETAALEVGAALYALAAAVVRRMPRDLSLTAAATLYALERQGPQRLTYLAAQEGVAQPSMTALVTKLEQAGLVERRADPSDGRAVLVGLTPAGGRYVRARRQSGARALLPLLAGLSREQLEALRGALPALRAVAAAELDAPGRAGGAPSQAPRRANGASSQAPERASGAPAEAPGRASGAATAGGPRR
jgi:DNA-binding MarR family transcriptional regulator